VEDQGSCGSCWTFATYGSLESYLLPAQLSSFSENNLNNAHGFDTPCCNGGDMVMSTAYLARWGGTMQSGPVATACDPYTASCSDTTSCSIQEHVQNVYFLPLKQSPMDNNAIKSALMTYGGVYSAFDWLGDMRAQTTYWNPSTAAYYDHATQGGNHAVTIVGWDDNFPATSFSTAPPGNGAWICKNSWGTSWGQSGYFYVSYYDKNMGSTENAVVTAEPVTNYAANYQYDPLGWVGSWGSGGSSTLWGANVFTAQTGNLKAVGLYAVAPNMQYTIQIYTDPTNTPTDGKLVATQSGSETYAGYYTIPLGTTVPLTSGHKFAVVIEFTTPGYPKPLPTQEYIQGYSSNVINSPGQSYYSRDGSSWSDWYNYDGNAYVVSNNIKAFATTAAPVGVASAPAVCAQGANSLDLFVRGTDSALYWKHWNGQTWSAWTSLGGILTSDPAAASPASGKIDVFVRGTDGGLWQMEYSNGGWHSWTSLGGIMYSGTGPAASSWGSGRLDVFVVGTDHGLWHQGYNGAWSGWESLGGILTSDPAAASPASGKIDVFVRGTDGGLWQMEYSNGGWHSWTSLGGIMYSGTGPAASSWGSGRLDVFVVGTDHGLWHQGYNGAWSGWESLGGILTSSPAAASPASGKIDVFVRGTDGGLWQMEYSNGGWGGWTSLGGM
jgi:C1A family cysteine protease